MVDITTLNKDIIAKIEALYSRLRKRNDEKKREGIFNVAQEKIMVSSDLNSFLSLQKAAEANDKLLCPKPLDLSSLDAKKSKILNGLYDDNQQQKPVLTNSLIYNMFMIGYHFFYPSAASPTEAAVDSVKQEWAELENAVKQFNAALKKINRGEVDYIEPAFARNEVKLLGDLTLDNIRFILTYLDFTDLKTIYWDKALSKRFQCRELINPCMRDLQRDGFKQEDIFFFNPLSIRLHNESYNALIQLRVREGFHPRLFKNIDPLRLEKAPVIQAPVPTHRFEGANLPIPAKDFPPNHRVVRGTYPGNKPFIAILNQKNHPVTFYQRDNFFSNDTSSNRWANMTERSMISNFAELMIMKISDGCLDLECTEAQVSKAPIAHVNDRPVYVSYAKWQEWLALLLGYINASCPQKDGSSCDLLLLADMAEKLKIITDDNYGCVDKSAYPDLDLPPRGPSRY